MGGGAAGGEGGGGDAGPIGDEHGQVGGSGLGLDAAGGIGGAEALDGGDAAFAQAHAGGQVAGLVVGGVGHVACSSSSAQHAATGRSGGGWQLWQGLVCARTRASVKASSCS